MNQAVIVFFLLLSTGVAITYLFRPEYSTDFQKSAQYVLQHSSELGNATQTRRVNEISNHILKLVDKLRIEEDKLRSFVRAREETKAKGGFFWPFCPEIRGPLDLDQLRIQDQTRAVGSLYDHICLHWREIKGVYGVYSRMFLWDLFYSVFEIFVAAGDVLVATLSWGLLWTILFTGPLMFASAWMIWKLGVHVWLPASLFLIQCLWLVQLPGKILEYNPTFVDFVVVYFPILALLFFANFSLHIPQTPGSPLVTPRIPKLSRNILRIYQEAGAEMKRVPAGTARPRSIPVEEAKDE